MRQANAAFAGAGVKVGEGSAAEVERDITQGYEHDAFQALLEGGRRASGLRLDGQLTRINGDMQETAGYVNAVGTVLSGVQSYMRQSGGWKTGPVTKRDLDAANRSSDPLGELNRIKGWT